jgi:hypothetical protein
MYEIITAFYIDNDMNHMIMMVCIPYDFCWLLMAFLEPSHKIWFDF